MNPTYRQYLQSRAPADREAQAVLHVVGDDFKVDPGFANQQLVNGMYNWQAPEGVPYDPEYGQVGAGSYWYGPRGISTLNDKLTQEYKAKYPGNTLGEVNYSGSTSGTGDSGSSADLAYLDTQENNLRDLLRSALDTKRDSLTQLQDSYNKEQSTANQQRSRAMEDFQTKRTDTEMGKSKALDQTDRNANTLAASLRRILGLASGTGSSAYQFAAPTLVARQASENRENVLQDYGQNFRDLGTAEKRAEDDFESLLADLEAQRNQKESGIRSGVLQQQQSIQEQLSNIAAERAKIQGGGYDSIMAAQQPFQGQISNMQSQLDNLFERFRTPYSVQPVNVQAPNLRDYTVDRAAINANRQAGGPQANSPYQYFLNRNRDEEERI